MRIVTFEELNDPVVSVCVVTFITLFTLFAVLGGTYKIYCLVRKWTNEKDDDD